jgi:hypothetical protein
MKKLALIVSLLFSLYSLHAQGPGTLYGAYKFMGTLGIPKDTLLPPTANRLQPHVAGLGDSLYLWSWRQGKWIIVIGAGGGGTTYSNGYGLTLASNVFKVDTFAIETRARSLKQLDSLHAVVTYTNGLGILPLAGNVIAVDTFQMATKPYAKFVGDSIRRQIGIPTLDQVLFAGAGLTRSYSSNLATNTLTFTNGPVSLISDAFGGTFRQSRLDVSSISSYMESRSTIGVAYENTTTDPSGYPIAVMQANNIAGTVVSNITVYPDSTDINPGPSGDLRIRTLNATTDTAWKIAVWKPGTTQVKYYPYWPAFGGGGGTIRAYYVDNIIRSGFDSLFYWRSDTSFAGRAYKLAVNSSKLTLTRPAGENSDSTTSWLLDVVEANISRNNLGGGALSVANGGTNLTSFTKGDIMVATGATTLVKLAVGTDGQVITADAAQASGIKWATPAGGGGAETDPLSIHNQYTYQTGAAANIKSLTVKDTLWMPGGDSYIVEFPASGSGSNWINMSTGGASGIGTGGVGQDAWIAYAKFSGQYFPDATAGSIVYRSKTANLYFGVGTGTATSVMQIMNSSATVRITKAGSTIIYDTSAGKPLVVDASGNVIGRGYWYGGGAGGSGTVTTVSVVSANGFAGTVATATTTPAITLTTTVTGMIKGNGTAFSAATADVDFEAPHTTLSGYGITDALSNSTTSTQDGYFSTIKLKDVTNPSHYLTVDVNEDLTAARTLHIVTGDATRTLTFAGNATVSGNNTGDQTISLTNDLSGSGTGTISATITTGAVSNSKLAQMAAHTYKGNNTGSTADAADITATQLTADLNTFTSSLQGLAPSSGGGTTNFLRADGTWAAPPSGFTNPMTTLGDIIYEDATPTAARLAGNTTSTKKFLTQTGTGSVSAAPGWNTLAASDIPSGATNYIQNQNAGAQSSASFFIDGSGRVGTSMVIGSMSLTMSGANARLLNGTSNVGTFEVWVGGQDKLGLKVNSDGSITSDYKEIIGLASSDITGMTEGNKFSVKLDNSANGVNMGTFRVNQTASSTSVSSALQPWLRTTHATGTVADVRTFVSVYDQGSASAVTEARVGQFSGLISNTTAGTIGTLKLAIAKVDANTGTAGTIDNLYGFYFEAPGGAGTITFTNQRYAFYNNDASAATLLKGKVFFPSLGTTTPDKSLGYVSSTGEVVALNSVQTAQGSFSPTFSSAVNCATSSTSTMYYTRVGNWVTVWGQASMTSVSTSAQATIKLDIPVASNLVGADLYGTVTSQDATAVGYVTMDDVNDKASVQFKSTAASTTISFQFGYLVH